jgi:hypothetical protein
VTRLDSDPFWGGFEWHEVQCAAKRVATSHGSVAFPPPDELPELEPEPELLPEEELELPPEPELEPPELEPPELEPVPPSGPATEPPEDEPAELSQASNGSGGAPLEHAPRAPAPARAHATRIGVFIGPPAGRP